MATTPWLKALRLPFLTATLVPIILGTMIAWSLFGSFNLTLFLVVLLGAVFMHLGVNLSNDYFDHTSGNDSTNKNPTPFSGGSRVIQENLIKANHIHYAALTFFALGALIGLYLNSILPGNTLLYLGLLGVFIGYFYTASPIRLSYRGVGELMCAIGFGPLMVLGAFYAQTGFLNITPFVASLPVGLLIALVLFINEFPDYEPDWVTKKNTLVVLLGKATAVKAYKVGIVLAYVLVITSALGQIIPLASLVVLLTLPIAVKSWRVASTNYENTPALLPANASTIMLHLAFGVLLIVAFALNVFI